MGDDQVALVEHEVTNERIDERGHLLGELRRLRSQLLETLSQAMGPGDVLPLNALSNFTSWLPGMHSGSLSHHGHHQAQDSRGGRAAVDQIAEEEGPAAFRWRGRAPSSPSS